MPQITKNSVDQRRYVVLADSSTGRPETGYTITDLDLQYTREGAAPSTKVDATALSSVSAAHTDNAAIELDATSSPGVYRIDWPDAAFASGADRVILVVSGPGLHPAVEDIQLVGFEPGNVSAPSGDRYCSETDIEDIMSTHFTLETTNDDGSLNDDDDTKVLNAIVRAEQRIQQYALNRYTDTLLQSNEWIRWCCATFAAVQLARRRGNAIPNGLQDEYDEYLAHLQLVRDGKAEVPGLLPRSEPGMTMSNVTYDQSSRRRKIRVSKTISAGEQTSEKPRHIDWREHHNRDFL